jgi:hypothetical protein
MNALQQNDGAGNMLTKSLLTIALLASLSATAQAGSTISDKSYWPSEARRETPAGAATPQRDLNSAFAYDRAMSVYEPTTPAIAGGSAPRYQGGPKPR